MTEVPPPPEGLLPIDKPGGPTSHDIVDRVRRALGTRRVGHCGTLDPFATGLLLVCVGRATRLARFVGEGPKLYTGTIRLGTGTDTDDITGQLTATSETPPPDPAIIASTATELVGDLMQTPPAFSAKKLSGAPAYRSARRGRRPGLKPVPVRVHSFSILDTVGPRVRFEALVSPGTYLRALARDLGVKLGVPACLESLRRCASGPFRVEDALAPDLPPADLSRGLIPIDRIPLGMSSVALDAGETVRFRNGRTVAWRGEDGSPGGRVRVLDASGALLGIAQPEESGGSRLLRPEVVLAPGPTAGILSR